MAVKDGPLFALCHPFFHLPVVIPDHKRYQHEASDNIDLSTITICSFNAFLSSFDIVGLLYMLYFLSYAYQFQTFTCIACVWYYHK